MTGTHAPARRTGRRRLIASVGTLLVAGTLVSSAAFVDQANLNLGGAGIGFPYTFDIGVVLPDGTVEQADTDAGFDWTVDGSETLVPGGSVTTTIPVFNNTPTLSSDTVFKVVLRNGDGTVAPGVPNITPFLRFTAQDQAGTALFTDATWDAASGAVGLLQARGSDALDAGASYTAGAAGSEGTITLTINYLDAPGVEALNGGQAALAVRIDATSVTP